MEDIARRAGIGKSTIYEYFPSKLELLTATGDFVIGQIFLDLQTLLQPDRPVRLALMDYLEYICTVMGSFGAKGGTFGANLMNIVGDREVTGIVGKLCMRYRKTVSLQLEHVIHMGQLRGEISAEVDPKVAASMILTIPNPPFMRMTRREVLCDALSGMLDLLFSGLAPR